MTLEAIKNIFSMWKNIFSEKLLTRLALVVISAITARTGSSDMAIYTVGITLLNIGYSFGDGFQAAAIALIGKSYGAKDDEKIRQYSNSLFRVVLLCSFVLAVLHIVFRRVYFSFFFNDVNLLNIGAICCILTGITVPMQVMQLTLDGMLKAMSKTKETLFANTFSIMVMDLLPLYIFIIWLHGNVITVWIFMLISQMSRVIIMYIFYRGSLKKLDN